MRKLTVQELGRKSPAEAREAKKFPIVVVLENIRSAYNVGAVFRSADAFFIEAVYLVGYTARPPHKEIHKTALGAEDSVASTYFKTSAEAIRILRESGYEVLAVEQAEGSRPLHAVDWKGAPLALVLGNEVSGVEQSTIALCDGALEIPQLGMKHSLNMATAAGVVLWELVRQRLGATEKNQLPS